MEQLQKRWALYFVNALPFPSLTFYIPPPCSNLPITDSLLSSHIPSPNWHLLGNGLDEELEVLS